MFDTGHNRAAPPFGRVVLVASLGGMDAFTTVLAGLPENFEVPIAVVQHRPRVIEGHDALVAVLSRRIALPVRIAAAGSSADRPGVTVVPAGVTATIDTDRRWILSDYPADRRPGDALLVSSAKSAATLAVILTGYQSDGARGCRAVKLGGGRVLVQDPSTASAAGMPLSVMATGCTDFVLPIERLSSAVLALAAAPGAADLFAVPLPPWARLSS
jgi:two-component system chemotaxis response regulator CheB